MKDFTLAYLLPESRREALRARLDLTDEEIATWRRMSRKMFVPFHGDGIISQFEGYEELEELDWDSYRERYGNVQRLDRSCTPKATIPIRRTPIGVTVSQRDLPYEEALGCLKGSPS